MAGLLGCEASEIVLTSGGSEANNHALKGIFFARQAPTPHIITTEIEHAAIINPCRFLERLGAQVTYLPVDEFGRVDPDDVRRAITPRTVLISVMHANNEVGTIQPVAEIGRMAREHEIVFHTDAAQSVGKIPANVRDLGVDLLSVAGHKLYGPKGVGALYVRSGLKLEPLVHGAGHESGRRAGTENILLDVGLGAACELAASYLGANSIRELRDQFWADLVNAFGDRVVLNGHPVERLPNTLNVSFRGKAGADILHSLDGVAAVHRIRMSFRFGDAFPGIEGDAGLTRDWNGRDTVQPWQNDYPRRKSARSSIDCNGTANANSSSLEARYGRSLGIHGRRPYGVGARSAGYPGVPAATDLCSGVRRRFDRLAGITRPCSEVAGMALLSHLDVRGIVRSDGDRDHRSHNWRAVRRPDRGAVSDALGVELIVGLTSAGRISSELPLPCVVVASSAVRDEGTSFHYLPPGDIVECPTAIAGYLQQELGATGWAARTGEGMDHRCAIP